MGCFILDGMDWWWLWWVCLGGIERRVCAQWPCVGDTIYGCVGYDYVLYYIDLSRALFMLIPLKEALFDRMNKLVQD